MIGLLLGPFSPRPLAICPTRWGPASLGLLWAHPLSRPLGACLIGIVVVSPLFFLQRFVDLCKQVASDGSSVPLHMVFASRWGLQ